MLIVLITACAHNVQQIQLPPQELIVITTSRGKEALWLDPKDLFKEGVKSLQKKNYERAGAIFKVLLKHFPDSDQALPSKYNLALAYINLHRFKAAIPYLKQYIKSPKITQSDRCDAQQQLAIALAGSGVDHQVQTLINTEISRCIKDIYQRIALLAKIAQAYVLAKDPANAIKYGRMVEKIYRRNKSSFGMIGNYYVALGIYSIGQAYDQLFRMIKFYLPTERMEKDLTDKAQFFLSAQSAYFRTIRVRNTYFAIKAGLAIARLYENFYTDLMNSEIPSNFTEEQRKIYFEELKKEIRPLIEKAIAAYKENLKAGRRLGVPQKWLKDAALRLNRLKKLLEDKGETSDHRD